MAYSFRFIESGKACECGCDEGHALVSDSRDITILSFACGTVRALVDVISYDENRTAFHEERTDTLKKCERR